ncbi:MAG: hypothetical protein JRI28_04235 [Deltaproteobacteria bacterium]|nr:hypothetical protein [Deltaproteobacteria bacterium]
MKIAFIHYHLKRGGVTTVLKQQIEALKDECEFLVLTGLLPEAPFPAETTHIPGIAYDREIGHPEPPEQTANAIIKAIYARWPDGCDLLHVHNPTLAKNKNFLKILKLLQKKGIKLFLQIHDFAEDGRPLSYFSEDEYISDCHYGVINSRDHGILLKAGLKDQGLHKIFNTVTASISIQKEIVPRNVVLYPIRAIRRKNVGEAILLSLFFKNNETLAVTLPPNSPPDIISYKGWKRFVEQKELNAAFDVGLKENFEELVLSSKFLLTTSITEGFGFSFLEPWTAKKLLWGRKLPDICRDFEKNGIRLDHLYTRLLVPLEWIGKKTYYEKWKSCILKNCGLFGIYIKKEDMEKFFKKATENDTIDFGLLDEAFQKQIISRVLSSKKDAERLISLNPFLLHFNDVIDKYDLIENNMKAVQSSYNKAAYKKNLMEIYSKVVNHSVKQRIDKKALLLQFLNPEKFSLLKWCDYVEQ